MWRQASSSGSAPAPRGGASSAALIIAGKASGFALGAALLAACAGDPVSTARQPPAAAPPMQTGGAIEIPTTTCPPTNPFCSGAGTAMTPTMTQQPPNMCAGEVPIDLTPAGVNIMIAVDGSPSMVTHWEGIKTAVRSLFRSNPTAQFGLHVFWGEPADVWTMSTANMTNNICAATHNDGLEIGTHTEDALMGALGDAPPGQWFIENRIEISPVIEPLNHYLAEGNTLADPTRTNYLVLLSDGNDNCFGSFFVANSHKLSAYEKVAIELFKKGIRIIPIGFAAPTVDASNDPWAALRPGRVRPNTDFDVLGTLLEHGGAALSEVPRADDPSKLEAAVQTVGQRITNCRFDLPANLDPNASASPFELNFSINGQTIARDRLEQNGWNFVMGGTAQVELFGDACVAIQAGEQIQVGKSCASDVCGVASIKVETKPRAVLLVLDSSASRIECVDGSWDCLSDPNTTPNRPPTFWEEAMAAVSTSLTAPINDDVEFGMQFFPSKTAELLSCFVEGSAEIAAAQGTEIGIMKAMLEKLPFGLSPVVEAIENVAANPGRLAETDVLGAVVVLSDGGDNCSGAAAPEIVSRMSTAAATLLEAGVKTYAVRYGSEAGRTAAGEEQLRALVTSGGTAVIDPMDPSGRPYVDAATAEELNAALAEIADRLATCSFALEGIPANAVKDDANIYLNGEVIPFDSMAAKQDGWAWVDADRTTVELYGPSCEAFKTNRRTSIVAEFGCPPVIVPPVE
jgi:hypothetical protein